MERFKKFLRESGMETMDVELTIAEIEAYCLEHGCENNGATRAKLVSEKADVRARQID